MIENIRAIYPVEQLKIYSNNVKDISVENVDNVSNIIDNLISETQPTELLKEPNSDDVAGVPDISSGGFDICNCCGAIYIGGSPTMCAKCGNSMEDPPENNSDETAKETNVNSDIAISENIDIITSSFIGASI